MISFKDKLNLVNEYIKESLHTYNNANSLSNIIRLLINNVKKCYLHIPYTYKHSKCFRKLEKKLLGDVTHGTFHDFDKLFMFIFFPFLGEKCINKIHALIVDHHPIYFNPYTKSNESAIVYKNGNDVDWVEAVIDWECARFTKPDKLLDSYDTFKKYYNVSEEYQIKAVSAMLYLGLYAPVYKDGYCINLKKTNIIDDFKY